MKTNMKYSLSVRIKGFGGHFFLKNIPHVLKVRIIADMKFRIECMMIREGVSEKKAEIMVNEVDKERRRWSQKLHGFDQWDSRLYDLVINIKTMSIDHAVDIIFNTVKLSPFQTTPESQKIIDGLVVKAKKKLETEPGLSPFFEPMRTPPWKKKK